MAHTITIVGLGNYGIDDLPLGIYKYLKTQDKSLCKNVRSSSYRIIAR